MVESVLPAYYSTAGALLVSVPLIAFLELQRRRLVRLELSPPWEILRRVEKIESVSSFDPLTGLRSGRLFNADLGERLATGVSVAVLYIDLDNFRQFNVDGHAIGDHVLVKAAGAIRRIIRRQRDWVYRAHQAGDEFKVLLSGITEKRACDLAQDVLAHLRRVHLSASIGVASSQCVRRSELLSAADLASQAGKREGKDQVQLARQPSGAASDRFTFERVEAVQR